MNKLIKHFYPSFDLTADDLFGYPRCWEHGMSADWSPAVDIKEEDKEFQIKVELPGIAKEDVAISSEDGVLTISGEKKQVDEQLNHAERFYGKFSRSFRIGDMIDSAKISATMQNGILHIVLPKSAQAEAKKIKIA
jgi:HSP20 family protein